MTLYEDISYTYPTKERIVMSFTPTLNRSVVLTPDDLAKLEPAYPAKVISDAVIYSQRGNTWSEVVIELDMGKPVLVAVNIRTDRLSELREPQVRRTKLGLSKNGLVIIAIHLGLDEIHDGFVPCWRP